MISENSPAHIYALHAPRPCCNFVAAALLQERGLTPEDPTIEAQWMNLDRRFWERICIWDADQPWSGLDALKGEKHMVRVLRGCPPLATLTPTDNASPWCEETCPYNTQEWWFVQVWDGSGGQGKGHTYLVQPQEDGTYRVLQSSTTLGYRDSIEAVWARTGRTYGLVQLR